MTRPSKLFLPGILILFLLPAFISSTSSPTPVYRVPMPFNTPCPNGEETVQFDVVGEDETQTTTRLWMYWQLCPSSSARFKSSRHNSPGSFELLVGQGDVKWDEFQPRALIRGLGTDFMVDVGQEILTYVIESEVGMESYLPDIEGYAHVLTAQQGNKITADGTIEVTSTPPTPWWEDDIYDTSEIEGMTSAVAGLWISFIISAIAWVLLAAVLLVVFLRRQKQPNNKWILLTLIGVVLLCTITSCILGIMAMGGSESSGTGSISGPTLPQTAATQPPPVETLPPPQNELPSDTATPSNLVEVTLINFLAEDVCVIYISPSGSDEWGENWLGEDQTLPPNLEIVFMIPPGTYDLAALDCQGNTLVEVYEREVFEATNWALTE